VPPFGGQYDPSVELLIANKPHKFESHAWSAGCTDILVFDEKFVDENVYSGSEVGAEHLRLISTVLPALTLLEIRVFLVGSERTVRQA